MAPDPLLLRTIFVAWRNSIGQVNYDDDNSEMGENEQIYDVTGTIILSIDKKDIFFLNEIGK